MPDFMWLGFFFGVFFGAASFFLFVVLSHTEPNQLWQGQAIERGYGLYCPVDGEFAWVGECEETNNDK